MTDMRSGDAPIVRKAGTADAAAAEPVGADGTFRRSIREIREVAYRALVATGASHGEATAAAEAAQYTEVQHGTGVSALVEDLASGPWPQTGLSSTRSGSQTIVTGDLSGPLRAGQLILDLTAAVARAGVHNRGDSADETPDPRTPSINTGPINTGPINTVDCGPGLAGSAPELLEAPLIRAAAITGQAILVVDRTERAFAVRCATPSGRLGADAAGHRSLLGSEHSVLATLAAAGIPLPEPDTSSVIALPPEAVDDDFAAVLTWTTDEERAAIRRDAAVHGVHVDAEAWLGLKRIARGYLQPEREDTR
ncbi:hypothetical protein [Leucobacter sp. GX24907]